MIIKNQFIILNNESVFAFVTKNTTMPIIINAKGASISLKGKVYPFLHLNNAFDIERFSEITFFQGAVSEENG